MAIDEDAVRRALGDLEELEDLGGGGQGQVWRVKQNGQETVVKVIPDAEPERVRREAESLKSISSSRVMAFHDTLVVDDGGKQLPAIRGEYIVGGTIADALQAGQRPTIEEALLSARGVLEGLTVIHDQDLVHRDIKPQNVALRGGAWDDPVVLDLGLVRDLVASSITRYPQVLGTLPFMSPEQLRLERAVKRTDVFAVGALLMLLISDQLPYVDPAADQGLGGDDWRRVMLARSERPDWPRWAQLQGVLDQDVAEQLAELLATEAYQRPSVARAIELIDEVLASRAS